MSDEHTSPTAIIPTRPVGIRGLIDLYREQYGCPVRELFDQAFLGEDAQIRHSATKEILSYRYAKPAKPLPQMQVNTSGGGVNIIFSRPPPAALPSATEPPTIDVTPALPDAPRSSQAGEAGTEGSAGVTLEDLLK
ncbi:MAG TPA: hypothetical protein VIU40_12015 [Geobacteraceae bacterium]